MDKRFKIDISMKSCKPVTGYFRTLEDVDAFKAKLRNVNSAIIDFYDIYERRNRAWQHLRTHYC